jgi:hypothetical protein
MHLRVFLLEATCRSATHTLWKAFLDSSTSCFHWATTHAAASLAGRGVRIREQLGVFPRADLGDGVEYPFRTVLGQQLGFGRQAGSSAMLRRAQLLLNRLCARRAESFFSRPWDTVIED